MRAHPKDPDPTWMGHSIGKWEGDTFVIDTVGFNEEILEYICTENNKFRENVGPKDSK